MENKWIKVSDKLPSKIRGDVSKNVLVIDEDEHQFTAIYDYQINSFNPFYGYEITHWVELPAPPTE